MTQSIQDLRRIISEFFCGLSGHDYLLVREPNRLYMSCMNCNKETEGWNISPEVKN